MSIFRKCSCKNRYALSRKVCPKCGEPATKSKTYFVKVMVDGAYRYASAKTLNDAKLKEQELKTGVALKIRDEKSLDEVWKLFLDDANSRLKAPEFYERRYRIYIQKKLGHLKLSEISTQTMQELIQGLDKVMVGESWNARTKNKVLSYTTRNGVIKTLKRLYTFAIKNGLYDGQNNAENLQLFKVDNAVENILPEEDFKRLIGVIRNWDNKIVSYAFLFCLYSGKRAGEVFGLTWDRVDFQTKNFVFLVKSQNKNKKQYYPMNQMLEKFVLNAKDEYNGSDTQFVFPTKQGKRILYGRSWTRIKKKAKIEKDFRVHDLRHTFATLLASSGKITMRELQFLLGHSTIAMTERYAHFFDSAIQKTVKVSGDVISESLDF